ncbi:unnamed protein product [Orchesella dallaii]|uniref:Phosducin domain-containing protein n=1 Tax=Orchesella dallaii TaxID=48710 RepID=A0ABP1QPT7_9HEXA
MTTLDDKLLGERRENYCSSSEDEGERDEDEIPLASGGSPKVTKKIDINDGARWEGYSQNTGPKGVIRDWQLFKAHEEAKRKENERKLLEDVKKSTITCRPYSEDVDKEIDELLQDDDGVLQEFINKRMETLMQSGLPKYTGQLHEIKHADEFLEIIDNTKTTVIVHIYDRVPVCTRMNECLASLCTSYPFVQFCCVLANIVGVTQNFAKKGVPALLVYKHGALIGNFVQLKEEFGEEYYETDVENFLIENGVISEGGGGKAKK